MAAGSSVNGSRWIPGILAFVLIASGCTATDEFVQPVGTTVVVLAAPRLAAQSVISPERVQVAEWDVREACLDLGGTSVDLVHLTEGCATADAGTCHYADTVNISPYSDDRCAGGVVIGATADEVVEISLALTFTMDVRRAVPEELSLDPDADYEGDGVPNVDDNCPMAHNSDQRDDNLNGVGDACEVSDGQGGFLLDSEGDGVPDTYDNCVWHSNPDQENTTGVGDGRLNDGIGDACDEQPAEVADQTGATEMSVVLGPIGLAQRRSRPSFITVDFDDALDCGDWSGTCRLDLSAIRLCVTDDIASAGAGCP